MIEANFCGGECGFGPAGQCLTKTEVVAVSPEADEESSEGEELETEMQGVEGERIRPEMENGDCSEEAPQPIGPDREGS